MALDSLGFGIGLQAQAKDYAGIAAQAMARDKGREKAEAAARAKNEEQFNKLITDKDFIQQTGNFHKLYRGQASKEVSDFFNRAVEAKKEDPNNYLPRVIQDFQQTQFKLNGFKQNSEKLIAYEKSAADPAKTANTWWDANFLKSVNSGEFNSAADWNKVSLTPGLGVLFNPETGDFDAQPSPKINDDEVMAKFRDKANLMEVSQQATPMKGGAGALSITTKSVVRPDVVEATVSQFSNDPNYVKSKAIEWGVDMTDPNWFNDTKAKADEYIRTNLVPKETQEMSSLSVARGGGNTYINNVPSSYSYEDPLAVEEKYIVPDSFLGSAGTGGGKSWKSLNEEIKLAKDSGDDTKVKELEKERTLGLKLRAKILYNASGEKSSEIESIINKQDLNADDYQKLAKYFSGKTIKSSDVLSKTLETYGGIATDYNKAMYKNWVNTYSKTAASLTRKVSKTFNIEDKSRLKNAAQNFDVEENGTRKQISNAEFLGVDRMEDGSLESRFRVNGVVKTYPYSSAIAEQIKRKFSIDISKDIEKLK